MINTFTYFFWEFLTYVFYFLSIFLNYICPAWYPWMTQTLEKPDPSKNPIWNFLKWPPLTTLIQTIRLVLIIDLWPILTLGLDRTRLTCPVIKSLLKIRNDPTLDDPITDLTRPDTTRNPKWPDIRWLNNQPDPI
jgi:hypothetical protein